MSFKFYQPNNKQEIAYDCVIRALSKVFNKSWLEVFDWWDRYYFNIGNGPTKNWMQLTVRVK